MDPDDFYKVAVHLKANPLRSNEDATLRTVVGRIYYSAFLFARKVMRDWGLQFQQQCAHKQVVEGLKCCGIHAIWEIGRTLKNLQDERILADYEIDGDYSSADFDIVSNYWLDVHRNLLPEWEKTPVPKQKTALENMRKTINAAANPRPY